MKSPFPLAFLFILALASAQKTCIQKVYRGPDNLMNCVCNATYCDEFPPLGTLNPGQAAVYTSSQSGKRFFRQTWSFDSHQSANSITITPDYTKRKQKIIGFGGAFTDSAGINLQKLSSGAQQNLIRTYFGPEGIGYTVGRTPMASSDFSSHPYSYDDVDGDMGLKNFALTSEDFEYKIPFIKMAQNLLGNKLKLFASPWSPPGWMKTSGKMAGGASMKGDVDGHYYKTWADYFVRYFEEYAKNGITYWGVTMENEPMAHPGRKFQALHMNSTVERDFAKGFLGQALRNNSITKDLKLMVLDHDRNMIPDYSDTIFGDPDSSKMVVGLAVHWYNDSKNSPSILTDAHNKYSDKFILYTEACNTHGSGGVQLGSWAHADKYANSIITVLQNWVVGWTDWNICLDPSGGPNWVNNTVDSPIIVSNNKDEFEKQPMFYTLGHFAKFILPDSTIIELKIDHKPSTLEAISALTPDGLTVIVLNNRDVAGSYQVSIMNKQGALLNLNLEPRSFTTIVFYD